MRKNSHTWNDAGAQVLTRHQSFKLSSGQTLPYLHLAFETVGRLSSQRDNAILIHHALTQHAHLCSTTQNSKKGWWEKMVGPGKPIDTNRYFVICINNLGSCFGSSGPRTINPRTKQPYGHDFPSVSIRDMVRSQYNVLDYLAIDCLHAIIGHSMGGMLALDFAIAAPKRVKKLISVSSCHRVHPVTIAQHRLQRDIIHAAQHGHETCELGPGYLAAGFLTARKLALLSYRHPTHLNARFNNEKKIMRYIEQEARQFVQQFDLASYLCLLDAMDTFDVTAKFTDPLIPFRKIKAQSLVVGVDSDLLYPVAQQDALFQHMQASGSEVSFLLHQSKDGHDAFYSDLALGRVLQQFLEN